MTITLQESPTLGARDPSLLLSGLQQISLEQLVPALESALRRVDDYLFDRSSTGGEGAELTALRDLRRVRPQLAQRFERGMIDGFRRASGLLPTMKAGSVELSLVDEDTLEQQLADEQMIDGLTRLHSQALKRLEARLAVLLERPAITPADNPVSPASIAVAMRGSVIGTELPPSVHIALFKFFERELGNTLKTVYDRANERLAAAGVLPRLDPVTPVAPPAPAPAPAAHGAPVEAHAASDAAPAAGDQTLFSSLVGLLQSWRTRVTGSPAAPVAADAPRLREVEMMSVLSLLQNDPPRSLDMAIGDSRQSLAEQLRSEVLSSARRLGLGGERVLLSNPDEDALDLVGMLFDVLLDERDFEPDVRRKIGRLLVPYVKVAVKDRRMFLYKGHPARRLLNAVAEACEGNHGDGPQERELLDRVDATIDRLVTEFNEDIAIFDTLEGELRAFMAQHRKRVELAEKRAAESQRGRERLEQARADANADLQNCRGDRRLPPALDDFVTHFVGHHLTQVILREGRESPRYGEALHAVAGLLAAYDMAELGVPLERQPAVDRAVLQTIMASSGCIGDSADSALGTMQRTLEQLVAGDDASASAAQLPERPMQTDAVAPPEPLLSVVGGNDRLDYDPVMAERMRALQVGTWVQLTSETGRTEPAKVSWVSPISARLLFVNRRGIRLLVASAEELAALAKLGRVQLREGDNVFEDAMHQVLGRLKKEAEVAAVGIA
ncbi:DUF1631 family protein [Lysobacter niastensis]|uniref:DUF1631 family protein n=1 Tax=Lysobacter niastensis TaxID=380629 RepID=A0ABS0BER6_9GAMM|nr:DUF1631 family protein [Lysobacter niastensis]MBF6025499.1 DUF1631 family protein [Lysobacter niastensis]